MAENTNPIDALMAMVAAQLLDVNTCMPGVVQSYSGGLARVLPTGRKRYADGDALDFPVIPNVRVLWPAFAGGAAGVKGPVRAGDKCLLVFAQQAVDGSDDRRMFDLSDAYAVMCDLGSAGAGDSGNNTDLTLFFGSAYLRISEGGKLTINAPGGTEITTPTMRTIASGSVTFDTPAADFTGALSVSGKFTYLSGMTGYGKSTADGRNIGGDHTHQYIDDSTERTTDIPNG